MAIPWRALAFCLAAVLAAVCAAWFWTTRTPDGRPFESCRFEGTVLVVSWTAGVDERTSVQVDTRDDGLVVSLRTEAGGGDAPSIGLPGEARFAVYGESRDVRDPRGRRLSCPTA